MRPPMWRRRIQSIRYTMISDGFSPNRRKQPAARGFPASYNVDLIERIHVGIQGTRPDPPIPGDRKARDFS